MNRSSSIPVHLSVLGMTWALLAPACGGGAATPATSPPAPAPEATTAPVAAPAPVAPETPAPVEAPPPPRKHRGHGHHGMAAMLLSSLESVELKPEQKTAVEAIESDLSKLGDQHKDIGTKLATDIADGVDAGKIDRKKTDADVKEIAKSIEATVPGIQDAVNRLHKTLDPAQRKQVVESMQAKAAEMRKHAEEHAKGEAHEHGKGGPGEHGKGGPGEHGKGGPGGHGKGGPGGHGMEPHGMGMGGRMHELAEELGITPEQHEKIRTKLEADMKARQPAMKAKMAAAEKNSEAIGKAFATDKFDAKKAGVGANISDMAKTMAQARVTFTEIVLGVLTPEQRTKLAAHLRTHAGDPD